MAKTKKKTSGIFTTVESYVFGDNNHVIKYADRIHLINKDIADDLNTYANFGIFPTFADSYPDIYKKDEDGKIRRKRSEYKKDSTTTNPYDQGLGTPGVKSLFNKAGAIIIGTGGNRTSNSIYDINLNYMSHYNFERGIGKWRISRNVPLLDSREIRRDLRKNLSCTVNDLVKSSEAGDLGRETYSYSDFMYCKHLGKMPNNYLITLRRFPTPVGDYIGGDSYIMDKVTHAGDTTSPRKASKESSPPACVGCMVTWMGVSGNHLNEILRYSYKQPFKEQQAELQDSKADADSNTSLLNGMFSAFDKSYQKAYTDGEAGTAANAMFRHFGINLGDPPYADHKNFKDRNKVYGPVDAIKSTYIRSDEGMIFNHKFTLTFEYELRAYNGINPRQAMLDLLSNILAVTYTTGSFWRGGIKAYGAQQSNIFANLNIFKKGNRTFTDFADSFAKDLTTIGDKIKTSMGINQAHLGNGANLFAILKGVLNTLGGMLVGGMLNRLGRPQKAMYNSLLSPAPIGFWHVTIGNPKAPIMSIGNLVLTNVQVEHNGPLGLDNFPTGLKVTVDLDRGKPRDSRDIEKLYMHGNDRIYSSMSDKVFDMYKNAAKYKQNKNNLSAVSFVSTTNDPWAAAEVDRNKDGTINFAGENSKANIEEVTKVTPNGNDQNNKTESSYYYEKYNFDDTKLTKDMDDTVKKQMSKKYGVDDLEVMSIYMSATEQEYGAGKKKKLIGSKNLSGTDKERDNNRAGTAVTPPTVDGYEDEA